MTGAHVLAERRAYESIFKEVTDEDRARWVGRAEFCRSYPEFLPYLEHKDKKRYEQLVAGFRILAVEATAAEWRSPQEGVGGRPEQLIPGTKGSFSDRTDWRYWLLMGGRGCIAEGARIEDPFGGPSTKVEDFKGGWVLARRPDGSLVPAISTGSFKKGDTSLYRVATDRGDETVVTAQHQFRTPSGWVRLRDISVGSLIAGRQDPYGQSVWNEDVRRLIRKPASSLTGCRQQLSSHGPQPHVQSTSDRDQLQQRVDVLVRTPSGWQVDDDETGTAHILLDLPSGHHPKTHSDRVSPSPTTAQHRDGPSSVEPTQTHARTSLRSPPPTDPPRGVAPVFPEMDESDWDSIRLAESRFLLTEKPLRPSGPNNPTPGPPRPTTSIGKAPQHVQRLRPLVSSSHDKWVRVVSIKPAGIGPYYDLTVPRFDSYVADGLVHHNSGKSRTGAEAVRELLYGTQWTTNVRVAFVGRTLDAVRTEMFINTFMQIIPPGSILHWRSLQCELVLVLPNGKIATIKGYSAERPDQLRGPNLHLCWADEIAAWKDARRSPGAVERTWSNLNLAVRALATDAQGRAWRSRIIATTTPKAVKLLRNLEPADHLDPGEGLHDDPLTVVSSMSTLENLDNLDPTFYKTAVEPYIGTRLYDQEVLGQLMDEAVGAEWSGELISKMGRNPAWVDGQAGGILSVAIGVDPATSDDPDNAEHGIVVSALCVDGNAYVVQDATMRGRVSEVCDRIAELSKQWGADVIVVEVNNGGSWITENLGRSYPNLPIVYVWAKKAKKVRSQPVALLSDRGRVFLAGSFPKLTHQMTTYVGDGPSPDRLDAFVYSMLHLLPIEEQYGDIVSVVSSNVARR